MEVDIWRLNWLVHKVCDLEDITYSLHCSDSLAVNEEEFG